MRSSTHRRDELLSHLRERCALGQYIWKLEARWDVITFRAAMEFLAKKGFELPVRLLIGGFLHIYYWDHVVAYALALMSAHPSISPCKIDSLDVESWSEAPEWIGKQVETAFKDCRVLQGEKEEKKKIRKS